MIESDVNLVRQINLNIKQLNIEGCNVIKKKVNKFLDECTEKSFDIIFIDPPYNTTLLGETLLQLKEKNFLTNNKFLYYEKSKKDTNEYSKYITSTHKVIKDLSIGDVSYTISVNRKL